MIKNEDAKAGMTVYALYIRLQHRMIESMNVMHDAEPSRGSILCECKVDPADKLRTDTTIVWRELSDLFATYEEAEAAWLQML